MQPAQYSLSCRQGFPASFCAHSARRCGMFVVRVLFLLPRGRSMRHIFVPILLRVPSFCSCARLFFDLPFRRLPPTARVRVAVATHQGRDQKAPSLAAQGVFRAAVVFTREYVDRQTPRPDANNAGARRNILALGGAMRRKLMLPIRSMAGSGMRRNSASSTSAQRS